MADPATVDLLGVADWSTHPVLGPLLADRTALCGDSDGGIALLDLDGAADDAVSTAGSAMATALDRLKAADTVDRQRVDDLLAEQTKLQAAQDPDPVPPIWVTLSDGVPLWRCLGFAGAGHARPRAGIRGRPLAPGRPDAPR